MADLTASDVRGSKCMVSHLESVYSRTIEIAIPSGTTAATYTLPGLKFAPGSYALAIIASPLLASTRAITTLGGTATFALANGATDIVSAAKIEAEKACTVASGFLAASTHAGDESFSLVIADASTPSAAMILQLTFVVAPFGKVAGRSPSVGN
jgi:hypothetical protein